uniref:Stomoxyn peptide in TFE, ANTIMICROBIAL n=1 Tax=Myoviridae sp. ctZ2t4 TaxID=2827693 RepID=A0A8S5SS12_9CAUD|nr:MAG TPA: stomoxyn peptide in TFE, ANTIMICROBIAL [Myoviridae sp. ctZ2t4]
MIFYLYLFSCHYSHLQIIVYHPLTRTCLMFRNRFNQFLQKIKELRLILL